MDDISKKFEEYMEYKLDSCLHSFEKKCQKALIIERLAVATKDYQVEGILMEAEQFTFELVEEYLGTEEENREIIGWSGVENFHRTARELIDSLYSDLGFGSLEETGRNYSQLLYSHGRPITFIQKGAQQ